MPHPGKKITELDEESVPLDASDIAVIVADVPAAPVTRKTALGTLRRFILGIATLGTVTIPEAVVVDGSVTAAGFLGNATTASAWATPRLLTIGGTGKNVNGSANVSWSLGEIGAAAAAHGHPIADISGLQAALDGKAPMAHTHPVGDLTGFGAAGGYLRSDGLAWARVAGLAWADVTGAPTTLAGYGITDGVTTGRALTVAGTAGRITSSAGSQTLAADRTWTLDLATTGVAAGGYGGATTSAQITVDAYGRITAASNVGITVDGGNIVGVIEVAQGGTAIGTLEALKFLRANAAATAYEWRTAAQIVTDGGGLLTSGNLPFNQITGLPNSLAGYGINDAVAISRTLAVNGTSGRVTVSGGTQNLSTDRTWTVDLATTGVGAGTYGGATTVAQITVDAYGRITSAGNVGVTVDGSAITGTVAVANGGTAIGTLTALRYLRTNAAATAYEFRTAEQIVSEGGGFPASGNLPFSQIISLPTSLAGYGITDGVAGPSSATANAVAVFNGTTGKLLKNSAVIVDGSSVGINIAPAVFSGLGTTSVIDLDGWIQVRGSVAGVAIINFGGAAYRKAGIFTPVGTDAPYLGFFTGSSGSSSEGFEAMRINASQNIGIGLTNPSVRLHVKANGAPVFIDSANSNGFKVGLLDNGTVRGYFGAYSGVPFFMGDSAGNTIATFTSSGITAYDFILSSDLRLKRSPTPIINARGVVRTVPGLRYWHIEHRRWELGFGAQHLLATAIGDLTTMVDSRGYFGVMYERTIPVLWNAVRDQDEDLEALKREVALLRHQLTALQHQPRMAA